MRRSELARAAGFALVTAVFAVIQPLLLAGMPLALLFLVFGPRDARSAIVIGLVLAVVLLGDRSGTWWFERGWSLILAGGYVWVAGWRPGWSFTNRALAALGLAVAVALLAILARPDVWSDIDALMAERAHSAARAAIKLLGEPGNEAAMAVLRRVTDLQVAVFPALLGISSLGGLGVAAVVRGWLAGGAGGASGAGEACGSLRGFRFNDHLVWVWLAGLVLILAPAGAIGERVGANALLFMGALYVVRGMAVLLSLVGGFPVVVGVIAVLVALIVYPILALALAVMLIVGLGDTWLDLRARMARRRKAR